MTDRSDSPEQLAGIRLKREALAKIGEANVSYDSSIIHSRQSFPSDAVIPFPSKDRSAASGFPSAAGHPPSDEPAASNFTSLGAAVQPVILRLANKRWHLKIAPAPALGGKDRGE